MEMCYDGALVMPNNFAVVNEEEMTYVSGGETLTVTFSRDFLRDCVTAGMSTLLAAILGALGSLGSGVCAAVCAAVGAGLGWIIGGSIARSQIKSDQSISVWIPFVKKKKFYIA